MTTLFNRRSLGGRVARASALCLLALAASLVQAREARAQWTAPDASGNISTTNTGNVGIGTNTPSVKFSVLETSTSQLNRGVGFGQVSNDTNGVLLSLTKSRGTPSAQTPAVNGDALATFLTYGHDGVGLIASSRIRFAINGAVSANSVPTELQFYTGANGGGAQRMVINSAGNIGVGTITPNYKFVVGPSMGSGLAWATMTVSKGAGSSASVIIGESVPNMMELGWDQSNRRAVINTVSGTPTAFTHNATDVRLLISGNGNVGIGTVAPATKLHVAGDITIDGNINAKYQDVAEWVPSTQKLAVGTVVIVDSGSVNHVMASMVSYDTSVAGVITGQPGLLLGEGGEGKVKVATTGRVKVRVDATRAPIRAGDLLVTSEVPGVAMRSVPVAVAGITMHRPGTLIGKALESLEKGTGEILVLLSLQ